MAFDATRGFAAEQAMGEDVCIIIGVNADGTLNVSSAVQGRMDSVYGRKPVDFLTRPTGLQALMVECLERAREVEALRLKRKAQDAESSAKV